MALLEQLGVELPIVQAGMGGGLASHDLAAAVSNAGGLGTIGILAAGDLEREIAAFRGASSGPLAVNLLLPLARRDHFRVAARADVLVTFWGEPQRHAPGPWIHQCGSVQEALAARAAGADAVIAQGVEAGGHVRGTTPALELLAAVREQVPDDYPLLSAGGVADAADVAAHLAAGAQGVVCGTRFLMSEESGASDAYKARVRDARETILTQLFGFGWPAPHRVIANEATARWLARDPRGPRWLRAMQRLSAPLLGRVPMALQGRLAAGQKPGLPLFGPAAATADGPANLLDAGPLYAGACVERIGDVRPAAALVRELAG